LTNKWYKDKNVHNGNVCSNGWCPLGYIIVMDAGGLALFRTRLTRDECEQCIGTDR